MTEVPQQQQSVADDPLVQDLYPIMSQVIDEHGGVCKMNSLLADPEVQKIRSQLPKSEMYKISKIIAEESKFFTLIENAAYVATATGYEKRLVDLQGELTESGKKHVAGPKGSMKAGRDDGNSGGKGGKGQGKRGNEGRQPLGRELTLNMNSNNRNANANAGTGAELTLDQKFKACRRKFNESLMNTDMDMEFDQAVNEARNLRRQLKKQKQENQNQSGGNLVGGRGKSGLAPLGQPVGGHQSGQKRTVTPRGAPENKRMRPNTDVPAQQQATSKAPSHMAKGAPSTDVQNVKLEKLMRAVVKKLVDENVGAEGVCLTHLSTADELRAAKSWMHPGMRFGEVFTLCYPSVFETRKDDRNQMFVTLRQHPGEGPCPPDATLEVRPERRRGQGKGGDFGSSRGRRGGKN